MENLTKNDPLKESDKFSLERFEKAQNLRSSNSCSVYENALKEIRNGKKEGHWIWYIFPQLKDLGQSHNSKFYGITGIEEAAAYLRHPVLGARLREITSALLDIPQKPLQEIFGNLDAMKVQSCMTLFAEVPGDNFLFRCVLHRFFYRTPDYKTLFLLGKIDLNIICGAMAGDIIGSRFEWHPNKSTDFELFSSSSKFTDDTVMTVAVAAWLDSEHSLCSLLQHYGNLYPNAGYGGRFRAWLKESNPQPYNSFGNGSAMRVSPVGWAFDTLEETLAMAAKSAEPTHNHPEGVKGAQAVAACIFLARKGKSKQEIKEYVSNKFDYDLDRTCDEIRLRYKFDVTCQGSVPESIIAFLESGDFESSVRLAVSLGGDADTQAAIAGSIAEAYYGGVPKNIKFEVIKRLPVDFINVMLSFNDMKKL
ncbi:MAG: DUF1810 family protein [Paludibacteraceae bacterium]|nr:DUF1810 family protein [Paludibacteraceae bacterium]